MRAFVFLCLSLCCYDAELTAAPPPGFAELFNGRDFQGWTSGGGVSRSRVIEGVLVTAGADEGAVTTIGEYANFELRLEYRRSGGAIAEMGVRGVSQARILGAAKEQEGRRADESWQHMRMILVGSRASVWVDDRLTVDHAALENVALNGLPANRAKPLPARGPIQLQSRAGEVRWRNLWLREIGNKEATEILARRDARAFKTIFNGRNLEDWAGNLEAVEAKAGVLLWRAGQKGTVYWNRVLTDFVVRVEFVVPPGGNNGLALRYPGEGIPAYDGMGEIQLRDDSATPLDKEERQAHGALYGKIGSIRGYQLPVGEWNFQEVTVRGSRIIVELNGNIILDGDVSTLDPTTFMAKRPHPGNDRPSGYFGFAGHTDPFQFRQISIKEL